MWQTALWTSDVIAEKVLPAGLDRHNCVRDRALSRDCLKMDTGPRADRAVLQDISVRHAVARLAER